MKIKMTVDMSGTRNGEPWPARGGEIELPDQEAAKYCASGLAIPVRTDDADVETRETKSESKAPRRGKQAAEKSE